jgi:uncharacterized protein
MGEAEPTRSGERLEILDVLRGFALYGVLLANTMVLYSGFIFLSPEERAARLRPVDELVIFLGHLFVDGKAMALLTFLFGLGFSLQLERAQRLSPDGRGVVGTHLRRVGALFLIGIGHVLLLWWGDILWGYAIAGSGLLLFRRVRGRRLLIFGLALVFVPHIVASLPVVAQALKAVTPLPEGGAAFPKRVLAAITGHDRLLLTKMHVQQAYYFVGRFWVPYFPELLGRFLIGYWAGTTRLFQDAEKRLPLFRKLAVLGVGIGLVGSAMPPVGRTLQQHHHVVLPEIAFQLLGPLAALGVMALACGYAATVVLLLRAPGWRRVLRLFAPAGQMALSTYLGQSVLSTFVFYGFGLGLAPNVRPATLVPITVAIFALLGLFAHLWLSRFRFGPMEWLWRSLTYGRIQPLRRGL